MNSEFQKFFPSAQFIPILRNLETNRYWINENLLRIKIGTKTYNIAKALIEVINEYIKTKRDAFQQFIETCERLQNPEGFDAEQAKTFIGNLIAPEVDARLFEIVSYAILKYFYHEQKIIWGFDMLNLNTESLKLFKTGRTNANDSGIDFVMKPLGRFFQVTETIDYKKYFLDIDKVQRYPITFVVKSSNETIVEKYMSCIEEVINVPILQERFSVTLEKGYLGEVLNELILQSKIEFNYGDEE